MRRARLTAEARVTLANTNSHYFYNPNYMNSNALVQTNPVQSPPVYSQPYLVNQHIQKPVQQQVQQVNSKEGERNFTTLD